MLAAILAGILLNNKTAQDLKTKLKTDFQREFDRLNSRLDVIESYMRQFYHLSGKHEGRLAAIEKRLG